VPPLLEEPELFPPHAAATRVRAMTVVTATIVRRFTESAPFSRRFYSYRSFIRKR
jgi:hypothetical protein